MSSIKSCWSIVAALLVCLEPSIAQNKAPDSVPKEDIDLVNHTIRIAEKAKSTKPIDSLLQQKKFEFNILKSQLYNAKSHLLTDQLRKNIKKKKLSDSEINTEINYIASLYDTIINLCDECCSVAMVNKGQLYSNYKNRLNKDDLNELSYLKDLGFRENKDGIGVGVHLFSGKNTWVGIDFSFLSTLQNSFKFARKEDDYYSYFQKSISFQALTLSLSKNWSKNIWEYTFSPFQVNAPFYLNPAKIGIQHNAEHKKAYFVYRPEIGFGWDFFAIGYSYNFMANRPSNSVTERNLFFLRLNTTINKKRK